MRTPCAGPSAGRPPTDVCRQFGVNEATFYIWKKKSPPFAVSELRKLRSLDDENARPKRLVADLTLDKRMLAEALRKWSKARAPPRVGRLGFHATFGVKVQRPVTKRNSAGRRGMDRRPVTISCRCGWIRELAHARPRFGFTRI